MFEMDKWIYEKLLQENLFFILLLTLDAIKTEKPSNSQWIYELIFRWNDCGEVALERKTKEINSLQINCIIEAAVAVLILTESSANWILSPAMNYFTLIFGPFENIFSICTFEMASGFLRKYAMDISMGCEQFHTVNFDSSPYFGKQWTKCWSWHWYWKNFVGLSDQWKDDLAVAKLRNHRSIYLVIYFIWNSFCDMLQP